MMGYDPKREVLNDVKTISAAELLCASQEPPAATPREDVLSFEIISLYVKKSCRKCRGRGYHVYSHATEKVFQKKNPDGSVSLKGIPKEWAEYCSCVIKGLNRAAKQVRVG